MTHFLETPYGSYQVTDDTEIRICQNFSKYGDEHNFKRKFEALCKSIEYRQLVSDRIDYSLPDISVQREVY